ncbi:MAG: hypothetical protein WCF84_17805 [Anaerolineae bacterium]
MENEPDLAPDSATPTGPQLIMGLTQTQFIIVCVLGVLTLLVICFIPAIIMSRNKAQEIADYQAAQTQEALANPSATPTATATQTPVTPTASPTFVLSRNRPRATLAPHTPVPGPLNDGWVKMSGSRSLRFEMDMGATGYVAQLSGLPGYKEGMSLLYLGADLNGADNHMVMKGYIMSTLNMDPNKGLEVISVGDRSYIHGPQPMLGAFDDKWYYGPRSTVGSTFDSPDLYRGQKPDWTGFSKAGTETFDGKACDVYLGDRDATFRFFDAFSNTDLSAGGAFDQFDRAETKIWSCQDGYLHQIALVLEGSPAGRSSQKGGLTLRLHFYDMDKPISVTAPTNSAALPPSSNWRVPTPAPTWTPVSF